jgi:hypothetical protein
MSVVTADSWPLWDHVPTGFEDDRDADAEMAGSAAEELAAPRPCAGGDVGTGCLSGR